MFSKAINFQKKVERFTHHRMAVLGCFFILMVVLTALFATFIAPYDPTKISTAIQEAPSKAHLLGTDPIGRDVLSRLIYAARVSVIVGTGSVIISSFIGILAGLTAGYFGRKTDMFIMRLTDMFMAFPDVMLILVVVSVVGPGLWNLVLVLGLLSWPGVARLVRGNVLSIKHEGYIEFAQISHYSTLRIMIVHILPNTLAPVIVNATNGIASAIITEAALSFLGMGVQPPTASWGNMLTDAQSIAILQDAPWLWLPPGIMILLTILSIHFMGDGLRDALDAKH